ncbi:MAG: Dienelactone hydrolase family protein [Chthonomonadales bacterium]|nr:Dienelactone hydrolase family protein [Chthonomonadales bacterium]
MIQLPWHRRILVIACLLFCASGLLAAPNSTDSAPRRARFHALLDRPHGPLHPTLTTTTEGEFTVERGQFESEKGQVVPFLSYRQTAASGRLAAVVVLHGTGGNKEGSAGDLRALARHGMLAIAIDARYHGARIPGGAHGAQEYNEAVIRAWHETDPKRQEHPFFYDTVYDLWRTVDYLQSRADVDRGRIGMIGFSMGGIETWMAAATDPRIRVVVPAIGVQSLKWSLENERWQGRAGTIGAAHKAVAREIGEPEVNAKVCRVLWNKVVPGILDDFDCPQMLPAIAPRPMLILSGENDPNCPLEGAKLAYAAATEAYKQAKAEGKLEIDVAQGVGHAVTSAQHQKAMDWLARWLSPSGTN